MFPYTLPNDSNGYKMSAAIPNPIDTMSVAEMNEAGRLFNINCAVCHGAKGQANGPLSTKVGAIANLTLDMYKQMKDGTMFHSITYGRNNVGNMGGYASQLTRKERWMVIKYVRTLQGPATPVVAKDSTKMAMK
jgi:mono/diheme cytochrome c family protein